MNAVERAREGYGQNSTPIKSARAAEYDTIARVSHRLRDAALGKHKDFPGFVAALSDNSRLWTALALDVAQEENGLPQELRARIFWLAEFTTHETRRILQGEADVGILIEVNAAILQGLRQRELVS